MPNPHTIPIAGKKQNTYRIRSFVQSIVGTGTLEYIANAIKNEYHTFIPSVLPLIPLEFRTLLPLSGLKSETISD